MGNNKYLTVKIEVDFDIEFDLDQYETGATYEDIIEAGIVARLNGSFESELCDNPLSKGSYFNTDLINIKTINNQE